MSCPHWTDLEPEPIPRNNSDGSINYQDSESDFLQRIRENRKLRAEKAAARKEQRRLDRLLNGPTPRTNWKSGPNRAYLDSVIDIIRKDVKEKVIVMGNRFINDYEPFSLNPYAKKYGISKKVLQRYYFKRLEVEPLISSN